MLEAACNDGWGILDIDDVAGSGIWNLIRSCTLAATCAAVSPSSPTGRFFPVVGLTLSSYI